MMNDMTGNASQKLDKEAQRTEVWTESMDKDLKSGHRVTFRVMKGGTV